MSIGGCGGGIRLYQESKWFPATGDVELGWRGKSVWHHPLTENGVDLGPGGVLSGGHLVDVRIVALRSKPKRKRCLIEIAELSP